MYNVLIRGVLMACLWRTVLIHGVNEVIFLRGFIGFFN